LANVLTAKVLDEQGNPISTSEYTLHLGTQGSLKYRHGLLFQNYSGIFPNRALWFVVYDEVVGKDTYWNSEGFTLKPGEDYTITLRLLSDEKDAKILTIEKIVDSQGKDHAEELVVKRLPKSDRTVVCLTVDKIDQFLDWFHKNYTIHATVVEQIAGKPAVKPGDKIIFSTNDLNSLGVSIFLHHDETEKKIEIEFESEFTQPYQGEIRRLTADGR